jgi:multisubunit Na+/H+ antiporter MnhG subunit
VSDVLVWALVAVAVLLQLASVLGLLLARDVFDRLHFTGPASTVAPACVALAVVIDEGPLSQAGLKSMLTALLIVFLNGILVHATARAFRVRAHGHWGLEPDERPEGQG